MTQKVGDVPARRLDAVGLAARADHLLDPPGDGGQQARRFEFRESPGLAIGEAVVGALEWPSAGPWAAWSLWLPTDDAADQIAASAAEVAGQVRVVFDADGETHEAVADAERRARCSAGSDAWVMIAGCSIRLSTPPRLSASVKSSAVLEEAARAGQAALRASTETMPPKPRICRRGERVLRMALAGRDRRPRSTVGWRSSHWAMCERVVAVALHAQRQRLHAAQREEAVERPEDRADRRSAGSRSVSRSVGVVAPITTTPPIMSEWPLRYLVTECTTMSKPSVERLLHPRARRRCCRTRSGCPCLAGRSPRPPARSIELEQRIGRRLDPDHLRLRPDAPPDGVGSVRST